MADLYAALRNAHNAGDTEAATRIAAMIKGQHKPQMQEAPQGANQPNTTENAQDATGALERGFNAVGNVAASGGRMLAGAVSDLANVGVGAVNAVGSANNWAENQLYDLTGGTIGNNQPYHPMAQAGYGDADKYLQPQNTGEQVVASLPAYVIGGEVAAPVRVAENAGRVTKFATSLINNLPAALSGELSEHNQGDLNAGNVAVNTVVPAAIERVAPTVVRTVRNFLPEDYGGISQAQKASEVVNPEYVSDVLQGGNREAQQAFRTATTDEYGNSILTPSQVMNAGKGAKYIRAEQRDLTRGDNAYFAPNVEAQKTGEGFKTAIDDIPTTGNGLGVQDTAQTLKDVHKERVNRLYNENRQAAQDILDNAPVKITELKFPESKQLAVDHLAKSKESGNVILTPEARQTLKSFNSAKISDLSGIDMWKRTLSEKAQKAYRNGDYESYKALNQVKNNLRTEADDVISSIDPNAGSIYDDADRYFAGTVEGYGKKSELQKLLNSEFGETAANKLFNKNTGAARTARLFSQIDQGASNTFDAATQARNDLASAIGDESRSRAFDAATTGEHFSPTKMYNKLKEFDTQTGIINGYSPRNEEALNDALMDAASRLKASNATNVSPGLTPKVAGLVGRGVGGVTGASLGGGFVGAAVGQEIGGRVGKSIAQGAIDRIFGTTKNATKYIQFLSDPANAEAVSKILANKGGLDAPASDLIKAINTITRSSYSSLSNRTIQPSTVDNSQPVQDAQTASIEESRSPAVSSTDFDPKVTKLYKALAHAETGGLSNRFIRTKSAESGVSTAYGAAQLTVTTAKDFYQKHPNVFTKKEKEYLKRFFIQGEHMKTAPDNDPVFGYGGSGILGGKEDRKMYATVVRKMLTQMIKDNGGSLDKTLLQWRGNNNDTSYFNKVANYYKSL
ncbi:hypothetical protein K3712_000547 [Escherichia coli]|nr:hypothetical protein [Escherichia coli]